MKIRFETWTINELLEKKDEINPKPQYQRTSVWTLQKKKLLLDSILRSYDLPKFYLNETAIDPNYKYEVTDGQQRMRAIWEFASEDESEKYTLDDSLIDNLNTKGLDFDALNSEEYEIFYNRFNDFELHIAIIENSTPEEIRSLFSRLQLGERLKPVELRHAIASNLGNAIFALIETHGFFSKDCRIPNKRYNHQDYLDHVITLVYYEGTKDLKANEIRNLYVSLSNKTLNEFQELLNNVSKILDFMKRINSFKKGIFKNKWGFVDAFYVLYKNLSIIEDIKPRVFADNFYKFESDRKKYNKNPESLIEDKTSLKYDKDLYDYIIAFKTSGAVKNNVKIRHRVFNNKFVNEQNFLFKKS